MQNFYTPMQAERKLNEKNVLFFLAHYDDEIGVFERIKYHTSLNHNVIILYLTSSSFDGKKNIKRENKTVAVLRRLGIQKKNIIFYGKLNNIPDLKLYKNFKSVYTDCLKIFKGYEPIKNIYTHSYEGGHPDHDAANIIIRMLCKKLSLNDNFFQFPLYSGKGSKWIFFKIFDSSKINEDVILKNISFTDRILFIKLFFSYLNVQPKAIFGLSIPYLLHMFFKKTQILHKADLNNEMERPHEGLLLYERRKMLSFEKFKDHKDKFVV